MVVRACNPSPGEAKTHGSLRLLVSQCGLVNELQAKQDLCLKQDKTKASVNVPEEPHRRLTSTHVNVRAPQHTYPPPHKRFKEGFIFIV